MRQIDLRDSAKVKQTLHDEKVDAVIHFAAYMSVGESTERPELYFNNNVGGLGERHDPETHLIPLILRAAKTGKPVTPFGEDYPTPDGTCIRDYIHVSDLAEAHIAALDHLLKGGPADVFKVGTGGGRSVKEVLASVEKVTGKKAPRTIGPRREGDPPSLLADSTKLQKMLGWRPKRGDLDGIVSDAWDFAQKQ